MKRTVMIGMIVATCAVATIMLSPRMASTPVPPGTTVGPLDAATRRALLATPQARDYLDRRRLAQDLRRFLGDATSMPPVERSERVRDFSARIDADLANARMSAGEAFQLQAALIAVDAADPARREAAIAALAARYRAAAAQREAAWNATLAADPRFVAYKASEARIVADVMAMKAIPGGLSRDEYLRRQLLQARVDAYD